MSHADSGRMLLLIAKAPLPGLAKSRLLDGRELDHARVARIADAFVRDTLDLCAGAPDARLLVAFAPRESEAWFREAAPDALLAEQVDGDLGARLSAAFDRAFALGASRAVLIGTDTPHLPSQRIAEAFDALDGHDCVLGPATDGGYYLVGLRRRAPGLFAGITWSTPRVLAETLERARALALSTAMLAEEYDVDEPADLRRLARDVAATPGRCPRTARVLRETLPADFARDAGSDAEHAA